MMVVLRRFWIQITSDRKRFGVLCAMLAIGLLLWGRIIVTSNLPRTAVAGGDDSNPLRPVIANSTGGGPSDKPDAVVKRVQLARLPNRDPFRISASHFPKPTPVDALTQDHPKLHPDAAENLEQQEARLTAELRVIVERFRLEAVMQGRPMAVINGKTYRLHGWLPAIGNDQIRFRLVQVGHRSVTLECEGRLFELKMEFPGSEER